MQKHMHAEPIPTQRSSPRDTRPLPPISTGASSGSTSSNSAHFPAGSPTPMRKGSIFPDPASRSYSEPQSAPITGSHVVGSAGSGSSGGTAIGSVAAGAGLVGGRRSSWRDLRRHHQQHPPPHPHPHSSHQGPSTLVVRKPASSVTSADDDGTGGVGGMGWGGMSGGPEGMEGAHAGYDPQDPPAPVPAMYWNKAVTYGAQPPRALRAHTVNVVGETFYVFGGCDARVCFNELYIFDADTLFWSNPRTTGDIPVPRRAHSSTFLDGHLYVFGGGDGPNYFNDLHILNTETLVWTRVQQFGSVPGPRRAHTTCLYNRYIYLFGGGDGARALNDVYRLNTSDPAALTWSRLDIDGTPPIARGYHTSTLVGSKFVVYGGSDGHECFSDCHILDLKSLTWSSIYLDQVIPRLSHTATLVGSYLFVIGGHDGTRYSADVLLLNLVTMTWETRKVYGRAPSGRGYHSVILHDSRLFVYGGYDGQTVFDEMWILELSASAYLPQITGFEIQPMM